MNKPYISFKLFSFFAVVFIFLGCFTPTVFGKSAWTTPIINQVPQNETVDPTGTGMDLFVEWLDTYGNADIKPAIGCGPAIWTDNREEAMWDFNCGQFNGCIDILFTYSDACGNILTFTPTYCMEDNSPPVCGFPQDLTVDCSDPIAEAIIQGWLASEIPTDISHPITTSTNYDATINCEEEKLVTWTYTDVCGNASTRAATITITDNTPPQLTTEANSLSVDCSDDVAIAFSNWLLNNANATAHDFCSDVTWTNDNSGTPTACNSETVVTFMAMDACNNAVKTMASFSILDTEAPIISGVPEDENLACGAISSPLTTVTATDNCDDDVPIIFTEFLENDTLIRLWEATDNCGNTSSEMQLVTFTIDNSPPVLSGVPADITLACTDELPAITTVTATDNCDTALLVVFEENTINNTTTYTWTVTDNAGNETSESQLITRLIDDELPVLSGVPTDITLDCGEELPLPVMVTASDNCDTDLVIIFEENITPEAIIYTWSVIDNAGNSAEATQVITKIQDEEAPVLSDIPADVILGCNEPLPLPGLIGVSDNCDANVSVIVSEISTPFACSETVIRTWTATDGSGNQTAASQTIILVIDTEAPILSGVPADISLDCVQNIPPPAQVVAEDNCEELIVEYYEEIFGEGCLVSYTIERTWTATDACANVTEKTQIITIFDFLSEIDISTSLEDEALECTESLPAPADIIATTTCEDGIIYIEHFDEIIAGICPNEYMVKRTWTVSDNCGTTEIMEQLFSFVDTTAPVFTYIPPSELVSCTHFPNEFGEPEIEDNCGAFTVEIVDGENAYNCDTGFDITRTWIATDACGNVSTAIQELTIWPDVLSPIFLYVPGNDVIQCPTEAEFGEPIIVDTCLDFEVVIEDEVVEEGQCPEGYTVRRTWTATNTCGDTETHSQTIVVLAEAMLNLVNMPENKTQTCDQPIEFGTPNCESNCASGFSLNYEDAVIENCAGAIYTRIWTAQDSCGNMTTASQTIEVIDETPPHFETNLQDKTITCMDAMSFEMPMVTDLCGTIDLTFEDIEENAACEGLPYATTRIWRAVDACGNASNTSQTIYIEEDNSAPVFDQVSETLTMTFMAFQYWEIPIPIATDNCGTLQENEPIITWENESVTYTWAATDACGNSTSLVKKINFDAPIFDETLGIDNDWFVLSPNPAWNRISVHFISLEEQITTAIVTDLLGRKWMAKELISNIGLNEMTLDISALPIGAYFLVLEDNKTKAPQRFLKLE